MWQLMKKEIGGSKVKASELNLLGFDVNKSVKGRKEGKDKEIKGEVIRPVSKKWSPRESEDQVQSWRTVWVSEWASKIEEKNRE